MRQIILFLAAVLAFSLSVGLAWGGVNVLTYHNDNSRTGGNLKEKILVPGNVNVNTFGKLFTYALDGDVYAQPLYVSSLSFPNGEVRNVVFVATEHNSVYALDADSNAGSSGGVVWQVHLGPSAATPTPDFGNRYGGFTEISPEVGITGTPVIDLSSRTLYLDAFTHEGTDYIHRLHALDMTTGQERSYSPVVVSAVLRGNGVGGSNGLVVFNPRQQLQRGALTLASGMLYVTYNGYGDTDPYHGWILGFDPANLQLSANHAFNSTPNSTITDFGTNAGEAGIWMGGSGLAEDVSGDLYLATGNGIFNAFNGVGGTEYGDTFLKLSTTRGLSVTDYFTPYNQAYFAAHDLDAGSGGVLLLPDQPGPAPHLMIGGGKPGVVYVINRDNFTSGNNHYNTNGNSDAVWQSFALTGGIYGPPLYFNDTVYFTPANSTTAAFTLTNGMLSLPASSLGCRTFPSPGAPASVSANGAQSGIIWMIERANPAILVADNADDVSQELYNSDQAGLRDQLAGGTTFAVPTVADGKVFVGGKAALSVFGLFPFTNAPVVGHYSGLFHGTNSVQIGQSGFIAVTVSTNGQYVARLQEAARLYSFTGRFNGAGFASNTLNIPRQSPLQLQLQFSENAPLRLSGTVENGSWVANITANEAIFNARTNPAPFAGRYTLAIFGPNNADLQQPQGNGIGEVEVSTSGQIVFHGTLADGTPVNQSTMMTADGGWPIFLSLYGGSGQVLGWVDFTNAPQSDLSGVLNWSKLPNENVKSYAAGFGFATAVEGSLYSDGAVNSSMQDFSSGLLILGEAGQASSFTNYFTINSSGTSSSTSMMSLNLSIASGMFKGSSPFPGEASAHPFTGIFLLKEDLGCGYSLNAGLSVPVLLVPLTR